MTEDEYKRVWIDRARNEQGSKRTGLLGRRVPDPPPVSPLVGYRFTGMADGALTEPEGGLPVPGGFSTRGPDPSSDSGSVSVLGYRLHAVTSEGEPVPRQLVPALSAASEAPSPSEHLTPVYLTDDDLAWLTAYVGELPYGLDPGQRIYRLLSRALQDLLVIDESGPA